MARAGGNVLLHGSLRGKRVPSAQCLQDLGMLPVRFVQPLGGEVRIGHRKGTREESQHARDAPAACGEVDRTMELVVQTLLLTGIAGHPHGILKGGEVIDVRDFEAWDGSRCGQPRELPKDLVVVGDVIALESSDEDALAWEGDDEPLLIQGDECLADGQPTDSEIASHDVLLDSLSRAHTPAENLAPDVSRHLVCQIPTLARKRRRERVAHNSPDPVMNTSGTKDLTGHIGGRDNMAEDYPCQDEDSHHADCLYCIFWG